MHPETRRSELQTLKCLCFYFQGAVGPKGDKGERVSQALYILILFLRFERLTNIHSRDTLFEEDDSKNSVVLSPVSCDSELFQKSHHETADVDDCDSRYFFWYFVLS